MEDLESWLGLPMPRIRVHTAEKSPQHPEHTVLSLAVSEASGKAVEDICHELKAAFDTGALEEALAAFRRQIPQWPASRKIEALSTHVSAAHIVIHDARTLADRERDALEALNAAQEDLKPLANKQAISTSAQAQLWKLVTAVTACNGSS